MKHYVWFIGAAICAGSLAGCVERRYVIYSDPPGAVVMRNGQMIGQTPVDDHFVYYGKYNFTLVKEGFETQQIEQEIASPWYEYFPLDFFSENIIPWRITDRRTFTYKLEPRHVPNAMELRNEAENLRNRGRSIGAGTAPPPPPGPTSAQLPGLPPGAVPVQPPGLAPGAPGSQVLAPPPGAMPPAR